MQVTFRKATLDDKEYARRVHHAGYHDVVIAQFGEWDPVSQNEFFECFWSDESIEIVLANGREVGYCCIEHRSDDIHVRELVIDPKHQGAGIGTAVLIEIQSVAAQRRVPIRLGVFRSNRAVRLYQRCGFAQFDETPTHAILEWRPVM